MIGFAHRGDSSNYPENTMLSFRKAVELEADGIELDVHKTKDNQLVVIHDEDVRRTFLGKGLVKDLTLGELKRLQCRKNLFRENIECKIPTLREVLELIKDRETKLNIELKTDRIHYQGIEKDVLGLIKEYGMEDRIILSSFNHKSIQMVKNLDSTIKVGLLYHTPIDQVVRYAKARGVEAIHPYLPLASRELIQEAHREGLEVNIYTVNMPGEMETCLKEGVDGIFTDYPALYKEIVENQNRI